MTRTAVGLAAALAAATLAPVVAQGPNLSGTWRLNRPASEITAGVGLIGLGAAGAPDTIHVTHAANGSVVIGSEENEAQSRLYKPGEPTALPNPPGNPVPIEARWDGAVLVAEGTPAPGAAATTPALEEAISLSGDGQTLTVKVTATTAEGERSSTLVYRRMTAVEPCASWSTPCSDGNPPR